MKKVILVVLLALSLNGSEFTCEDSKKRYFNASKLFFYAADRNNFADMVFNAERALHYVEKVDVACDANQGAVKDIRDFFKEQLVSLKAM